jgi:hypothetical protein
MVSAPSRGFAMSPETIKPMFLINVLMSAP